MNSDLIKTAAESYGLSDVYRSHTMHGNYPLLDLRGLLKLDDVIKSGTVVRSEQLCGQLATLWSGVTVRVSTPVPGGFDFDTPDPQLGQLLLTHVSECARSVQNQLHWFGDELGEEQEDQDPQHTHLQQGLAPEGKAPEVKPLEGDEAARPAGPDDVHTEDQVTSGGLPHPFMLHELRSLPRDVRLDRAQALNQPQGRTEDEERARLQEYAVLALQVDDGEDHVGESAEDDVTVRPFGSADAAATQEDAVDDEIEEADTDGEFRMSDADVISLAEQEDLMRAEGTWDDVMRGEY